MTLMTAADCLPLRRLVARATIQPPEAIAERHPIKRHCTLSRNTATAWERSSSIRKRGL
jgi:hypothetical protein